MSVEQLAAEALRLPAKERAELAASLWESIEDPYSLPADLSDAEAIELSVLRDKDLESGAVSPISHSQLMERLRS
jgi:putative addiction module component (TIGR02574 family)